MARGCTFFWFAVVSMTSYNWEHNTSIWNLPGTSKASRPENDWEPSGFNIDSASQMELEDYDCQETWVILKGLCSWGVMLALKLKDTEIREASISNCYLYSFLCLLSPWKSNQIHAFLLAVELEATSSFTPRPSIFLGLAPLNPGMGALDFHGCSESFFPKPPVISPSDRIWRIAMNCLAYKLGLIIRCYKLIALPIFWKNVLLLSTISPS